MPHRGCPSSVGRCGLVRAVLSVGRPTLRADTPRYVPFSPLRRCGCVGPSVPAYRRGAPVTDIIREYTVVDAVMNMRLFLGPPKGMFATRSGTLSLPIRVPSLA